MAQIHHHFKTSQREIAESPGFENPVTFLEVLDRDLVVKDDGLSVLNVTERGDIKHHSVHVIGVTSNLNKQIT